MKSVTKKILSLLLAAAMVVGVLPATVLAADAVQISSVDEITDLGGSYVLTADITVTAPIGSSSQRFTGTFDGDGHKVTVNITGSSQYTGMFAYVGSGATVRNFTIEDSRVSSAYQYTGLVAGYCEGTISDVIVRNSTVSGFSNAGGIVGYTTSSATVTRCAMESGRVAKTVSDGSDTGFGGIVGENNGVVSLCSNGATIADDAGYSNCGLFGGIVGKNNKTVTDCYNSGSMEGTTKAYYAGGIVGRNYNGSSSNSHNVGTITLDASTRSGAANSACTNCFYLDTCGASGSYGTAKSAEEFAALAQTLGENWVDGSDGYPVLEWQTWKYSNTAVKYTVEYYTEDLDGAGYSLASSEQKKEEPGTEVTAEAVALEGFTFDAANENNVTSGVVAEDLVLKFYYTRNSYNLTWDAGDGKITSADDAYTHGSVKYGAPVTAPEVEQLGYTSTWSKTLTTMPAEDTTITAVWKVGMYTVHWDANGGTCQPSVWSSTSGETAKVTYGKKYGEYDSGWSSYWSRSLPVPTHETMAFNGWFTEAEGGEQVTADTIVTQTAEHTLYAHWVEGYTVTLDTNGGYMSGSASTYCIAPDGKFTDLYSIPTPTRSRYAFNGWFDEDGNQLTSDTVVTGDVTYTAKWTPYNYYVQFNANGGTGTMDRQAFVVDVEQALNLNQFTKAGYRFVGWATWSSATSASYEDGAMYSGFPSSNGSTITLYAVWEEARHSLTLNVTPADAEVVVKNASGTVQKGTDGVYDLQEGTYTYSVSKYGYVSQEASVELTQDTTLNIELEKIQDYTVTFDVTKPEDTGDVVTTVTMDGKEIAANEDGTYSLIPSDYSYVVTASGCGKVRGEFTVTDEAITFTIALQIRTAWDGETKTQPATVTAEQAAAGGEYEGMEGWYIITNGDEMAWFANEVNTVNSYAGNALLANDIDLGGENWAPAGNSYSYNLCGTFDGRGHTIRGLNASSGDYTALFGYVKGTIRNVSVEGEVNGSGSNSAGIVAYLSGGSIENCASYVSVSNTYSSGRCGGVAAYAYNATITSCFNAGTLSGGFYMGAIAAYTSSMVTVDSCYNVGTLIGSDSVSGNSYSYPCMGGVLGYAAYGTPTIRNCYNAGNLTMQDRYTYVGSLVGQKGTDMTAENCYYLDTTGNAAGNGLTEGVTAVTEDVLKADETVAALGERYKADGEGVQQINSGYPVLVWQVIPEAPHEHTYLYTDNGDGTHTVSCANCDYSAVEDHTFADGECVCGAKETVEDPYLDETLVIYSKSLNLQSYIGVDYTVRNKVAANYDSFYVAVSVGDGEEQVLEPISAGSYTYFELKTTATQMTENLTATLYAVKDGVTYHGQSVEWNVRDGIMDKIAAIKDLSVEKNLQQMTLMVDMLNYGAAAQIRFNNRVDDLANNKLTDEHKAYATTTNPELTATITQTDNGDNRVTFFSENLSLESSIEFAITLKTKGMDVANLEAHISYGTTEDVVALTPFNGTYSVLNYNKLACNQLREPVSITIYDKTTGKPVSATLNCSVEAIAATMVGTQADIINATMRYGDSAEAYYG